MNLIKEKITNHYIANWNNKPEVKEWSPNKVKNFKVLEFKPTKERELWTYATCGMSTMEEKQPIELHLFSKEQDKSLIELLTIIAYYHRGNNLDLWHTINLGRPWQNDSKCSYGLISLPYLDGPNLENLYFPDYDENIKFYWLIPINEEEMEYKKKYGIENLEIKFEESPNFDYADPKRESVLKEPKGWFF